MQTSVHLNAFCSPCDMQLNQLNEWTDRLWTVWTAKLFAQPGKVS